MERVAAAAADGGEGGVGGVERGGGAGWIVKRAGVSKLSGYR